MAVMSLPKLNNSDKALLLEQAKFSIQYGLSHSHAPTLKLKNVSSILQQHYASFITLHLNGNLRGCIGTLEANQALIADVNEHAFAAAFHDRRFTSVSKVENNRLHISISVLGKASVMHFSSEKNLLETIQPHVDGLILEVGIKRSTFLPSVWESLPKPYDFLQQLKLKAGLDKNYWSDEIQISRYQTLSFSENDK